LEAGHGELIAALRDFRRARFLEPNYAGLPFQEGIYWLDVAPGFAIEPWAEALRRVSAERRSELYQNMLAHAFASHPEVHGSLWSLASSDPSMQMVYLGWATPVEFKAQLDEILHEDPALRRFGMEQLRRLFPLWMDKGDPQRMAFLMQRRPEWLKAGFRTLARFDAARGDMADAVDLMERYLTAPRLPAGLEISHAEAARRFGEDNGDAAAGMALYDEAMAAGREDEALETLRGLSASSGCPGYVHYLEGQLLVKESRIDEAWKALAQCPDGDQH
jgi:hypothetical protein